MNLILFSEDINQFSHSSFLGSILPSVFVLDHKTLLVLIFSSFFMKSILVIVVTGSITYFVSGERVVAGKQSLIQYLNTSYLDHILSNSAENIYHTQTLTTHLMSAMRALLQLLTQIVLVLTLLSFLFSIHQVFFISITTFFLLIIIIIIKLIKNPLQRTGKRLNTFETKVVDVSLDASRTFKEIKIFEKSHYFLNKLSEQLISIRRYLTIQHMASTLPRQLIELSFVLFFIGMWYFAINMKIPKTEIINILTTYALVSLRLLPAANNIMANVAVINSFQNSIELIYERYRKNYKNLYYDIVPKKTIENNNDYKFEKIIIKDLSFKYPEESNLTFQKVNLNFKNGEVIGIVGPSGVGKTTFLNVLTGLLPIQNGEIIIDGRELSNISELRHLVGYIPQDPALINATLAENISLSEITDDNMKDELNKVCELTGLKDVINRLPKGLDSMLGHNGLKLSGGQRQRIAIARTIYQKRRILIFDEATNALDENSEKDIINNIKATEYFGALIIITHRKSTLNSCNRVYYFDQDGLKEV